MFFINGERWRVVRVPSNYIKLFRSDGSAAVASCDDPTRTIYISEKVKGNFLKKVLCHELTHAAMFSYNVELTLEQEEIVADIIATYGNEIINLTNVVFKKIKRGF